MDRQVFELFGLREDTDAVGEERERRGGRGGMRREKRGRIEEE